MKKGWPQLSLIFCFARELSRFIAADRLNCVIDKVSGIVLTNKADLRTEQYLAVQKQGDHLIAKIQKLGRIITY